MKSVLISIQPKWCELIASGKKTVEVRKTKPKLETPFKVYIYCTKNGNFMVQSKTNPALKTNKIKVYGGKVIGEFVCDEIYTINKDSCGWFYRKSNEVMGIMYAEEVEELYHCIPDDELKNYLGHHIGYGWHISNLVIYDKPRELSEFITPTTCKSGIAKEMLCNTCCLSANFCSKKPKRITRPPQSWCYVEEMVGE